MSSRHCAVIGHPIAHSLSPAMHRAAYRDLGLDWIFDAV
ncbi:MAG: shikimate dehydrogenase, partial [Cutibacterium granulosum]|nr:shikimate dehydrogenase [Cutibacterium granulosum]